VTIRETVLARFAQVYGHDAQYLVRAPGRANLIGEHTDYNEGFVMPLAVNRAVWMAVAPREDDQICVFTIDYGDELVSIPTNQVQEPIWPHWTTYIRGAWWLMQQQGQNPCGADILIGSDIPIGGGMSSSAAIGVASIEAVLALLGDNRYTQKQKALLAVDIEHKFTGVPVGVMDQMASAIPEGPYAILLDCRSLETEPVVIPQQASIVVINSMKPRQLVDSEYALRRQQCEDAAKILGVKSLRDATLDLVNQYASTLGDVLLRRARHVVTENERTLKMRDVLMSENLTQAGELINNSHYSLRDDYEVSIQELDILTEKARQHQACFGARIMGGGFGGCAVSLVQREQVSGFVDAVKEQYAAATGLQAEFYVCEPTAGSSVEFLV